MTRATNVFALSAMVATAGWCAQQPPPAPPRPAISPADAVKIRIGPGDLLQIAVYDEPELAQNVRVDDKGGADLLLVGNLHLAGMSTTEAQALLEARLKQGDFLLEPRSQILIAEYKTQQVSVVGEVKKPGAYDMLGARNLVDVVSMAGGTTPFASSTITIKRRTGTRELVKTNFSNNPDQLLAAEVEIEPGDTIVVPKAGIVYVMGEVGRPGAFVMQDDGAMSLAQAIALASGCTHEASETKARVIRKLASGFDEHVINLKRIFEGKDPDPGLQADDIIYVPSSALKSLLARAPSIAQSAASAAVYQGVVAVP